MVEKRLLENYNLDVRSENMDFKNMSKWGKMLYVISWINIIEAFAIIILASISIENTVKFSGLTNSFVSNLGPTMGLGDNEIIKWTGIADIIYAVLILIVAILAIRACRNNDKVTLPLVLYGINFILTIISIVVAIINHSSISILSTILAILAFVCCLMIKLKKA